jgi:proline dehydrogenase
MESEETRWVLPNLNSALKWCKVRNEHGLCCTLDILGENITSQKQAEQTKELIIDCAQVLDEMGLDAAIAVKLTNLGVMFNKNLAKKHLLEVFKETIDLNPNIELDMEGKPLVDFTMKTALECAENGYFVTLALQVYLDRTPDDIRNAIGHDITVRLVKGAYMGDTNDFQDIQKRFKLCFNTLLGTGKHFSIGTHDPELIEWVKDKVGDQKDLFEIGFLKGLDEKTKINLVNDGWAVTEYVPFGKDNKAYIKRRMNYVNRLELIGRKPML